MPGVSITPFLGSLYFLPAYPTIPGLMHTQATALGFYQSPPPFSLLGIYVSYVTSFVRVELLLSPFSCWSRLSITLLGLCIFLLSGDGGWMLEHMIKKNWRGKPGSLGMLRCLREMARTFVYNGCAEWCSLVYLRRLG